MMEFNRLTDEIFLSAEATLKQSHDFYSGIISGILEDLEQIHKTLKEKTKPKSGKKSGQDQLRAAIIDHVLKLKIWIGESTPKISPLFIEEPWADWWNHFGNIVEQVDKVAELPYVDEADLPEKILSGNHAITKKIYRLKLSRFQKNAAAETGHKNHRTFNLHHFLQFYLGLPVSQQLNSLSGKYLSYLSGLLFELHSASEKLKDDLLCTDQLNNEKDYWILFRDHNIREDLDTYFRVYDEIKRKFANTKNEWLHVSPLLLNDIRIESEKLWPVAGSPYCPSRKFSRKVIDKEHKNLAREQKRSLGEWKKHYNATWEEWLKDLEISEIQFHGIELHKETSGFVDQKLTDKVLPVFREIEENVTKTMAIIGQDQNITDEQLKNHILTENRALVKNLRFKKLPQLVDAITQAAFPKTFREFFKHFDDLIEVMRNEYTIFTRRDLGHTPPDSEYVEVRLKELIQDEILVSSHKDVKILLENLRQDSEAILRGISSLDQIVEFNLEAAYNLLTERKDKDAIAESRLIASEGLERTLGNLHDLRENLINLINKTTDHFSQIVRYIEYEIQKLGDNEKILELKLRLARAKTKERYREIRQQIWANIKIIFPAVIKRLNDFISKVKTRIFEIQKVTRLGSREIEANDQVTRFLVSTHQKINKMPYVYQRLFRLDPLKEKRFFASRESQVGQLRSDFDSYKQGFNVTVSIIGEKGNGKTTILNFAENEIFIDVPVVKMECTKNISTEAELVELLKKAFNYPKLQSIDEFELHLQNDEQRRVCYFENIHNLFTRTIDGFDLIERFLLMISNTRSHIFWLVTSGLYGWEYLDKVVKISDYFKKVMYLNPLTMGEVQDIIMKRHQVSGYGLWFEESDKALRSRQYRKLTSDEQKQAFLRDQFFEDLLDESGGNIKSAILFWLSAIKKFGEDKIEIAEELGLDSSIIYRLTSDELFTLAALVQHEYLTYEVHARIFNQEPDVSRSILGRLYKKGFLDQAEGKYSVHPFMYLPVVKALKAKNILN